jgi:putative SOS response-associated peptidase YedK
MCGRYFRRSEKQAIAERYRAGKVFGEPLAVDYNIAPTTMQPVVRLSRDSGEREMALLRWGLVPFFAGSLKEYKGLTTFVARAETVAGSATWREPLKRRRCLVPMDGYYEWAAKAVETRSGAVTRRSARPQTKGGKQPYAITLRSGEPMAVAGLWDAWREPKRSPQEVDHWLQSFAMITVEANDLLCPICERMPAILRERDWDEWLSREEREPPLHLLRPFEAEEMVAEPCNTAVGNVRNNGPAMLVGAPV